MWEDPEVFYLCNKKGKMISEPRHPLPLSKATCASLPCWGFFPSYSNSPYLNAKFNEITKHSKGFEHDKVLGKGVE